MGHDPLYISGSELCWWWSERWCITLSLIGIIFKQITCEIRISPALSEINDFISSIRPVARVFRRGVTCAVCICMYEYATLGGSGGMLPQEIFLKLGALRLLLRPSWDRSRAVVGTCSWSNALNFWLFLYAFTKPANFKFPREKVLRLAEQRVHGVISLGQLSSAWTSDLFTRVFTRVLSWQRR